MILAIRPYCFKVGFFKSCWRVQGEAGQKLHYPPENYHVPISKGKERLVLETSMFQGICEFWGGVYYLVLFRLLFRDWCGLFFTA